MPITETFVPESERDLSRDWLSDVLKNSFPESDFSDPVISRIGESYGFASRIFRCQWQENNSTRSVVVKLWSTDSRAGTQEIAFYKNFPDIGIRIPKYHNAGGNEQRMRGFLILEYIDSANQGDCLVQLRKPGAANVSRALAQLHGRWSEHPRLNSLPWLPHASQWNQDDEWFGTRRSEFLDRFDDYVVGFPRQLLDNIERAPEVVNEITCSTSKTLIHDDFHLDNIIFEEKSKPVILDWSNPVVGPSANNLIDFLVFMTSLNNFDLMTRHYLSEFNRVSRSKLDETELKYQLGGALINRFSRATCGVARWHPSSPRGEKLIKTSIASINRAVTFWNRRHPALFSFVR